jgi:hypothetical protein
MAIDTSNKRFSVIAVDLPIPRLPTPIGAVQRTARHMLGMIYAASGSSGVQILKPTYSNSDGSVRLISTAEIQTIVGS